MISLTQLENGNFLIRKPVDFLNLQISCKATVPGQNLFLFFSFPSCGFSSCLLLLISLPFLWHLHSPLPPHPDIFTVLHPIFILDHSYHVTSSLLYNYNFELKLNKRCSVKIIFGGCYILMMYWCHMHTLPHILISSFHQPHPFSIIMAEAFPSIPLCCGWTFSWFQLQPWPPYGLAQVRLPMSPSLLPITPFPHTMFFLPPPHNLLFPLGERLSTIPSSPHIIYQISLPHVDVPDLPSLLWLSPSSSYPRASHCLGWSPLPGVGHELWGIPISFRLWSWHQRWCSLCGLGPTKFWHKTIL